MSVVYETKINKIGPLVSEFLGDKMLILFGENAPEELADYCLSIEVNPLQDDIQVGDRLVLGSKEYMITAVGDAVKKNLTTLGHITLKFDGATEVDLPGTLYLEDSGILEVVAGTELKICR